MLPFLLACTHQPPDPRPPERPVTLHFAFLNDFHGGLYEQPVKDDPSRALGGFPFLAAAIGSLRQADAELVVLDGGDLFQGSWPVNASQGIGAIDAYNLLGVTAAAVGNHEFDYGGGADHRGALAAAAERAKFAWLSANVHPLPASGLRRWTLVERKGVKIGIIGLTTVDTPTTTTAANVADLTFADPVATVRDLLPEVRAAGAEVVAVVGHLSGKCAEAPRSAILPPETCTPDGEIGRLLTELPPGSIDILAVGHAHTLIGNRIGDTFVFEDRAEGVAIGRLDLVVTEEGIDRAASVLHPPWFLSHASVDPRCEPGEYDLSERDVGGVNLAPSPGALALVRGLEGSAGSLCEEIGCAEAPLSRAREAESGAGDLVADLMRAAFPAADVAVQNSGGIRADLPGGKLRREHVQAVMPFQNRTLLVEISGAKLLTLFRIGSSGAHGLPQVSGARYRFDPTRTGGTDLDGDGKVDAWETDRLCWVDVGGVRVDPGKTYRVATTDFLLNGGDHLGPALADAPVIGEGALLRDVLITGIDAAPTCLPSLPDKASPRIEIGACEAGATGAKP